MLLAAVLAYRPWDQPRGRRAARRVPRAGEKVRLPPGAKRTIRSQSQGLAAARVVVHRAYHYSGQTPYPLREGEKLIAVDAEFTGTSRGFDLDDVDVVDAATGRDHGGSAFFRPVLPDGHVVDWGNPEWEAHTDATGSVRFVFLYTVPSTTSRIKLNYWGQMLTPRPAALAQDGPSLPLPSRKPPPPRPDASP
jgi:hypothetical protein